MNIIQLITLLTLEKVFDKFAEVINFM